MRTQRLLLPAALLVAAAPPLLAQCSRNPNTWLAPERFRIRQNLDQNQVARPAYAEYTKQAGDTASYAIALGVRYDVACGGLYEFGPYLAVARNSVTDAPQNTLRGGLSYDVSVWDIASAAHTWTPNFTGSVGVKRDAVKGTRAVDVSAFVTPVVRAVGGSPSGFYRPNVITRFAITDFMYTFAPGLEVESQYSSRDASAKTSATRAVWTSAVELYPAAKALHSRVALRQSYEFRYDVARSATTGTRSHGWFESAATYYPIGGPGAKPAAGIEFAYAHGADPSNGLARQEQTQLRIVLRN